jgi:hypothetical protein
MRSFTTKETAGAAAALAIRRIPLAIATARKAHLSHCFVVRCPVRGPMAIYGLLQKSALGPDLAALGLKDTSNPITNLVAKKIIEIGQTGIKGLLSRPSENRPVPWRRRSGTRRPRRNVSRLRR